MHARNPFLAASAALLTTLALAACGAPARSSSDVQVFRTATCGCCLGWAEHLEQSGFSVDVIEVDDLPAVKQRLGVPSELASCHTAEVDGYVVEGHVPASDVQRLLRERPKIRGLAVPGMPEGSPGMEGPHPESYAVLAFDAQGRSEVFELHAAH
jgi:hypothetical protein